MDRFDRIFDLHKLLTASRLPVSRRRIEEKLECSRATAKRIIDSMRLYLNAPIKYDREQNGYYYDRSDGEMYELPGIWFNASELHALLSAQQLLTHVQPGLLEHQLAPLKERINTILQAQPTGSDQISHRVRILKMAARPTGEHFQTVAGAVADRHRLCIDYHNLNEDTQRNISPQRLVHYRDNWYIDAYCHLRNGLRTFALDIIQTAKTLSERAIDIPEPELDQHYATAYGIFAGKPDQIAILHFTPERASWVARETWHPQQQWVWQNDGYYELQIPYSDPRELIMDIMKHGPDVEVMKPCTLRKEIARLHQQAAAKYGETE
ncbi:MAG: WYL domain-containing protein [Gammaproteobacteria bacterium]|nr:WYL domain-containing protein [Gammaproteobacteria bacterium]